MVTKMKRAMLCTEIADVRSHEPTPSVKWFSPCLTTMIIDNYGKNWQLKRNFCDGDTITIITKCPDNSVHQHHIFLQRNFTLNPSSFTMWHTTWSIPRHPLFLHALSFEYTIKLFINFLNPFLVYFYI